MRWAGHVARMGEGEVLTGFFLLGGPKARDHWEDLGVGGRITLRWTWGDRDHGANWIRLAQDRVQWRAFVNTVMNLRAP
jgi:hypothetical protein